LAGHFLALRVRPTPTRGDRWLLCAQAPDCTDRKYYLLNLEADASLQDLVTLARSRWPIEQQYRELKRELKDDLGFDHFEGRRYRAGTHHSVLVAIAYTFLQTERIRAPDMDIPTLPTVRLWVREIFGLLYVIHTPRLLPCSTAFGAIRRHYEGDKVVLTPRRRDGGGGLARAARVACAGCVRSVAPGSRSSASHCSVHSRLPLEA
jgi:hypothetical protein